MDFGAFGKSRARRPFALSSARNSKRSRVAFATSAVSVSGAPLRAASHGYSFLTMSEQDGPGVTIV